MRDDRVSVTQTDIEESLQVYLLSNGRNEDFIKRFVGGYCSGISSLWLYTKWLQTQPNPKNKPRDDYDWFKKTVDLIVGWDGKRGLTKEEASEFESFISHIQYFQHIGKYRPIGQGELSQSLLEETGEKRHLKKEYSIASLFTLKQLKELLSTDGVVQEEKLILISSHNHATALFKHGGVYYYFDPNSDVGEVEIASSDKVADLIFDACKFDYLKPSPIGIRIFNFGKVGRYPSQEEVLHKIKAISDRQVSHDYALGCSGLMMAANIGGVESVKVLLDAGNDPNMRSKIGWNALMFAVVEHQLEVIKILLANPNIKLNLQNNFGSTALALAAEKDYGDIVRLLLKNNADPNISSYDGWSPFMMAIGKSHVGVVRELLEGGVDPDAKTTEGWTALMIAAYKGDIDIVKVLLENGANPSLKNNLDQTAASVAAENGHMNIVKMFLISEKTGLISEPDKENIENRRLSWVDNKKNVQHCKVDSKDAKASKENIPSFPSRRKFGVQEEQPDGLLEKQNEGSITPSN